MERHFCQVEVLESQLFLGYGDCIGGVDLVTLQLVIVREKDDEMDSAKLIFSTWEICH